MENLSEDQLSNFKKAFELFDKDKSGAISKDEIKAVFKELQIKVSEYQLQQIIQRFDQNGDDSIQFEQFLMVVAATFDEPESEQWMYEVFQIIDQDSDGIITKFQLIKVVQLYELQIQQKQIDLIIEEGDPLSEGGINYQEFSRILRLRDH